MDLWKPGLNTWEEKPGKVVFLLRDFILATGFHLPNIILIKYMAPGAGKTVVEIGSGEYYFEMIVE